MKIVVVTSSFPNSEQPGLGLFVKERMFKVGEHCELKVVAPVPWFPLINRFKKGYRPHVSYRENQNGIEVYHPRFFNIPRHCKFLDGFFFFLCTVTTLRKLKESFDFDLIDSHFAYPDGFGAVLLGKFFHRPVTITIRGTIRKYKSSLLIAKMIHYSLKHAAHIFSVCEDLRSAAIEAGAPTEKTEVVANGVDIEKFKTFEQSKARQLLGIGLQRKVIISVGGLTERKGFHRVIDVIPQLKKIYPNILYLIVGGASVEGNNERRLRNLVDELDLAENVFFAGSQPHDQLYLWLNAADLFCLATSNEGWANVFLEAMACGLPVVTTDVGGNPEVVCSDDLGILFPLKDSQMLFESLNMGLARRWNRDSIVAYASSNTWDDKVEKILKKMSKIIDN